MKKSISEWLEERKVEVKFRTDRTQARRYSMGSSSVSLGEPQLSASPVVYEIAEKTRAVTHGGIPLIHQIVVQGGLVDAINAVPILTSHIPYFESDHLLNIACNFLCGCTALDHIEYRRQDPTQEPPS